MPQLFRIGPYLVYFWSNENNPVEPVPLSPVTEIAEPMIIGTESGKALLCNNHSKIPQRTLVMLLRIREANSDYILQTWKKHFEELRFYC